MGSHWRLWNRGDPSRYVSFFFFFNHLECNVEPGKIRIGENVEKKRVKRLLWCKRPWWLNYIVMMEMKRRIDLRNVLKLKSTGPIFLPSRDLNSYWLAVILRMHFLTSPWSAVILCGKLSAELYALKVSYDRDRMNKS